MNQSTPSDIEKRDDANEIAGVTGMFKRWALRHVRAEVLLLVQRRLDREVRRGRMSENFRVHLNNIFRRVFMEDTDA